jgi:hypothetical protein
LTVWIIQERVIYNKEVQTTAIETEPSVEYEEELRQRIYRERDLEAERVARDKELEEESVKLDEEIEQEIRGTRVSLPHVYLSTKTDGIRTIGGGTSQYPCSSRVPRLCGTIIEDCATCSQ